MTLASVVGILLLVGVLLYIIHALPAVHPDIKRIIHVVIVAVVVVWLVSLVFPSLRGGEHLRVIRVQ